MTNQSMQVNDAHQTHPDHLFNFVDVYTVVLGRGKGGGDLRAVVQDPVGDWNLISRALIPAWVSVDGFIEGMPDISKGGPRDLNRSLGR